MAQLLNIAQTAKICNVERTTIYRWIKNGKLKAVKLPSGVARVKKDDLLQFLKDFEFPIPAEMLEDSQPRILIVDDDLDFIKSIIPELQKAGTWKIEFAEDGFDACIKAGIVKPDVVLLDLRMADIHGKEVCQALKANPVTSKVKVVAITGFEEEITDELKGAGFEAVFKKPVNLEELTQEIAKLLNLPPKTLHLS